MSNDDSRARIARAQREFDPETVWLNSATLGLPPARALTAVRAALADWQRGHADPVAYGEVLSRARARYAELVGIDSDRVAVGSQVSVLVGMIASALPPNAEVLTVPGEFTSVTFPFLARGDLRVREVPLAELAGAVRERTAWVAVSAVQSADGRVADLAALRDACARTGTRVLLDTTQAVGWLPIDAGDWAVTVCGAYKWLLHPRGAAYLTIAADVADAVVPTGAGWYAGDDVWRSIYGTPLRLATNARRFDVSPAWLCWIGAVPALELLAEVGRDTLHTHATSLAQRFCRQVGLPFRDSAIVSCHLEPAGEVALAAAGIVGAVRAERLRLSFHISTTEADVDRAATALAGLVHDLQPAR